jgi:DNA-binding MarR family transcriptional regulator
LLLYYQLVSCAEAVDRLRNFGFLLKDLSQRYVLRFEQRAQAISLTLPQCKALARLENNEGASQARLAELAAVDPMTMVRILDRMETDGLIERRPDPADRRARCLYLTARGRKLLAEIWHLADLTRAETFKGISSRQRKAFMDMLERMHRNVCALSGLPPDATARKGRARPSGKTRTER